MKIGISVALTLIVVPYLHAASNSIAPRTGKSVTFIDAILVVAVFILTYIIRHLLASIFFPGDKK